MNELRWILLGIGVLVIAGIYFWEVFKQKRYIRSRIENYPSFNHDNTHNLSIRPGDETETDVSGAIADLNVFLNDSRQDIPDREPQPLVTENAGSEPTYSAAEPANEEKGGQKIIVIYITAKEDQVLNGEEIAEAVEAAGMTFGAMDIYHYTPPGQPQKNLFSLANMHEPGTFDPDTASEFNTDGLAMFLCLPAAGPGEELFDQMLGCARQIAADLDADLRNEKHEIVSPQELETFRATAAQYH